MSICVAQCFGRSNCAAGGIGDVACTGGGHSFCSNEGSRATIWSSAGDGVVRASQDRAIVPDDGAAESADEWNAEGLKCVFSSSFYSLRSMCEGSDTFSGDRSYVVSKVAVHPTEDLLCVTERRSRVALRVFQTKGKEQPTSLACYQDVAHLDVECLAFSGDGDKLGLLRNLPDVSLLVFSVDKMSDGNPTCVAGPPLVVPLTCESFMSGFSFHPQNWRYACVFGSDASPSTLLLYWPLSLAKDTTADEEVDAGVAQPVIRNVRTHLTGASQAVAGEDLRSWCASWEDSQCGDGEEETSIGLLFCGGEKGRVHAISFISANDVSDASGGNDACVDPDNMCLVCPDSQGHVRALINGTESCGNVSSQYVLAASSCPQNVLLSLFVSQPKTKLEKTTGGAFADAGYRNTGYNRQPNVYYLLAVFRTSLCSPIRCQAITQLTRIACMRDVLFADGGDRENTSFLLHTSPILEKIRESMSHIPNAEERGARTESNSVVHVDLPASLVQWGFCGSRIIAMEGLAYYDEAEGHSQSTGSVSCAAILTDTGILHIVDMSCGEMLAVAAVGEMPVAMKALPMSADDAEAGRQTLVITYHNGYVRMFYVFRTILFSNRTDIHSVPSDACKCVFFAKVSDTPISHVAVIQEEDDTLIVGANPSHQFFFRRQRADPKAAELSGGISYQGCARVEENLSGCAWLCSFPPTDLPKFLCGYANGEVRLCMFPPRTSSPTAEVPAMHPQLALESAPAATVLGAWRLDVPSRAACVVAIHPSAFSLIVQSADRDTKLYVLDLAGVVERRDREMKAARPNFIMRHHDKDGVGVSVSRRTSTLASQNRPQGKQGGKVQNERLLLTSWGSDGRVVMYDVSHYQEVSVAAPPMREKQAPLLSAQPHVSATGGVASVLHVGESDFLLSAGLDGVVKLWSGASGVASPAPYPLPKMCSIQRAPYPLEFAAEKNGELEAMRADAGGQGDATHSQEAPRHIVEVVESVRNELGKLWHDNASSPVSDESERVPLLRFLPKDVADAFTADCAAETARIASDASYELLRNEYVREKIEHGIAGKMVVPSCTVSSLNDTCAAQRLYVSNFPITDPAARCHRDAEGCKDWMSKLRFLRRIQEHCESGSNTQLNQNVAGSTSINGLLSLDFVHGRPNTTSAEKKEDVAGHSSAQGADGVAKPAPRGGAQGTATDKQGSGDTELSGGFQHFLTEKTRSCFRRSVLDVATRHGAVVQSRLVEGVVDELKRTFNTEFDALRVKKRQEMSRIGERRARCESIAQELGESVDPGSPLLGIELLISENSKDDESGMRTVEVAEVLQRHPDAVPPVEVDADEKQVPSSNVASSSSEAALKTWMDGLQKESRALQVDIPLPDFADETNEKFSPVEDRTEEQQVAWKAFEKAVEKRVAEVNTLKEAMRDEYRRLCKDNYAASQNLDASIVSLNERRMLFAEAITELELCASEIIRSAALQEWRKRNLDSSRSMVHGLAIDARAAQVLLSDAEILLTSAERQVDDLIKEDAKADSHLHEVYPFSDPGNGEKLLRLFTRRKPQLSASHPESFHGSARKVEHFPATQADPRKAKSMKEAHGGRTGQNRTVNRASGSGETPYDVYVQHATSMLSHLLSVSEKVAHPQGDVYPEKLRLSFQEFVSSRVVLWHDALGMMEQVAMGQEEREKALQHLFAVTAAQSAAKDREREALTEWKGGVVDIGQLYRLRQRQVEMMGSAQVPLTATWKTAMLVRAHHISELNALLHSSSAEAAQLSREWSSKRKRMHLSEWEAEYLEYCVGTLEMELRHLHTLRVTREMQEFVVKETEAEKKRKIPLTGNAKTTPAAGGLPRERTGTNRARAAPSDDDDGCSAEKERLLNQLAFLESCTAQKIAERDAVIGKLRQQVHNRRNEALYLQDELEQISVRVADCDAVHTLRQADGDESKARKRRMREVREARDLEDIARAQQEELLQLKDNVDHLRERTFPSFDVMNHGKTI